MKKYLFVCLLGGYCLYAHAQAILPACVEDSLYAHARSLRDNKQMEAALLAYQAAAVSYATQENWSCYFNSRKHVARILRTFKKQNQAYLQLKSDLIFAYEKLGEIHTETAELYDDIANTEQELGLAKLELKNRLKALEIRKKVFGEQSDRVATSYLNLAITLRNENRLREAYHYAEAGVRILEKEADSFIHFLGNGYNILGFISRDLRRHEESLYWYKKALEVRRRQNNRAEWTAMAIQNLGLAYENQGNTQEALAYLEEAKAYIRLHLSGDPIQLGRADFYIGKAYKRDGQLEVALSYYQKILPVYEAAYGPHSMQMAVILNAIGEIHFLLDHFSKAYSTYRQARQALLPEMADFPAQKRAEDISAIHRLACQSIMENEAWSLLMLSEQADLPVQKLQQSLQLFDFSLRLSQLSILNYQEREDREWGSFHSHRLYEGAIEASWELFQLTADKTQLARAFAYNESSKASLLRGALKASAARDFAGIPDEVLHLEQQIQIRQDQWEQRVAQGRDSAQINQSKAQLFRIHLKKDSLQRQIEQLYPAYYQLRYAHSSTDITAFQQKLKKGEWLISYFTGEKSLYGFALSQQKLIAFQNDFGDGARDSLELFYQQLSDGSRVKQQANLLSEKQHLALQAHSFFAHILQPLWDQMPEKPQALLIVPDGILSHLPFELMLADSISPALPYAEWPFLLKKMHIRYLPSAEWLLTPALSSQAQNKFAGFAPIYSSSAAPGEAVATFVSSHKNFVPLSENRKEVTRIHSMMGGQQFLAESATEQAFWQHASESRILHLAMHSQLDEENPLFSALVFSQSKQDKLTSQNDGFLYAYELYQMKLDAELIVLSACESGYGKILRGEGVMSLARSFQYAGCKNILMSLWQVDDQSTADLMVSFYQNIEKGMAKDEALRQAKLQMLENSPFKHPYFWAAFILSGDDMPMGNHPTHRYLLAMFVLVFSVVGALVIWKIL